MPSLSLYAPLRTERQAMKELVPAWINLFASPEGLVSSSAHLSEADALDDISSPAEGWAYVRTIVSKGDHNLTVYLADEARDYAERVTRKWRAERENERGLMSLEATGRV